MKINRTSALLVILLILGAAVFVTRYNAEQERRRHADEFAKRSSELLGPTAPSQQLADRLSSRIIAISKMPISRAEKDKLKDAAYQSEMNRFRKMMTNHGAANPVPH